MAYKQSPGRGNNAKTGHGIPSPFKQEEPKTAKAKAQVAKKEASGATYQEIKSAEKFANKAPGTGLISGTEMNIKDMDWQLDLLMASPALSSEARTAAKYASQLLRAFRTIEDLNWMTDASDLHSMALRLATEIEIHRGFIAGTKDAV